MASSNYKRLKHANGFTLIEVLIALVILAIAMTAIIKVSANDTRNVVRLKNAMTAHWVALNIINRMHAKLIPLPTTSPQQGQAEMLNHAWYWRATLGKPYNTYTATVIVTVGSTPTDTSSELTGYLAYATS